MERLLAVFFWGWCGSCFAVMSLSTFIAATAVYQWAQATARHQHISQQTMLREELRRESASETPTAVKISGPFVGDKKPEFVQIAEDYPLPSLVVLDPGQAPL